jgi:hypothetical protein
MSNQQGSVALNLLKQHAVYAKNVTFALKKLPSHSGSFLGCSFAII